MGSEVADEQVDDDNYECPDWSLCIIDISPEIMNDYWEFNNRLLSKYNKWTSRFGYGGLISGIVGYIVTKNGQKLFSPEFIALLAGAGMEPTFVGEMLLVAGFISEGVAFLALNSANNLQDINNAIVRSGARESGGSIIVSGTTMTIISSSASVDVTSFMVGWLSVVAWSRGNSNLIPTP